MENIDNLIKENNMLQEMGVLFFCKLKNEKQQENNNK